MLSLRTNKRGREYYSQDAGAGASGYRSKSRRTAVRRKGGPYMLRVRQGPAAPKLQTKLKLNNRFTLTPGADGVSVGKFISANAIYDPTGGDTVQPIGYDQYANFYDNYRVIKSKITAYFLPSGAAYTDTVICGIRVDDNATLISTNINDICGQGDTTWKVAKDSDNNGGFRVTKYFDAKTQFGTVRAKGDDTQAEVSANPVEQAYFCLFVSSISSGSTAGNVFGYYEVEYTVEFSEPKDLTGSSV